MNQDKTSRSKNDALSLPALKGGVSRAKTMKKAIYLLILISIVSLTTHASQDKERKTEVIKDSPINLFLDNVYTQWEELKELHRINGDEYDGLETIIRVKTAPGVDVNQYYYDSVTFLKNSGNKKYDDIALLSVMHANPTKYLQKLSSSELEDYREIHIMFGVAD